MVQGHEERLTESAPTLAGLPTTKGTGRDAGVVCSGNPTPFPGEPSWALSESPFPGTV